MEYEVKRVEASYDQGVFLPIWQESLPQLDKRRLEWSYRHNINGPPVVYLLRNCADEEAFGCLTVFPREFYLRGRSIACGTAGDYAIKKRFRMLAPALALQKEMLRDKKTEEILIGFPNEVAEKIQMRVGFETIGNMILYVKLLKSIHIIKDRRLKILSPVIDSVSRYSEIRFPRKKSSIFITDVREVNEKIDQLWEDAKTQFGFVGNRSASFLKWRYFENPYKDYRLFVSEDREARKITGYIVYEEKGTKVYVIDFLWNGCKNVFYNLFSGFCRFCRESGFHAIYLQILANPKIDRFLKRSGFVAKDTKSKVLISDINFLEPAGDNIFITRGDDDF